jgi:hypothetical protein
MKIRTLRVIPRVVLMLVIFSLAIWLLGRSGLPKQKLVDAVLAIGMLVVQVLMARNWYVSEREAADRIKKAGSHDPVDTFRTEQELRTALREAAKVCWDAEEGYDAR